MLKNVNSTRKSFCFNRTSLFLLFLCYLYTTKSQVVFCPKGATWNYSFKYIPVNVYYDFFWNEKVYYEKDTLLGNDTVKIIRHRQYYIDCYTQPALRTYIKQKGDTVFFHNPRTQNTWQILYNFAASPGNGWQTTVLKANNTPHTYTYLVDSVTQIIHNGFSLKRLRLNTGEVVIERYGAAFLFPFTSATPGCDGYWFWGPLCYNDSVFGFHQFSEKSCSFGGAIPLEITELITGNQIQMWPNPAKDRIIVNIPGDFELPALLKVIDLMGKEVFQSPVMATQFEIDIQQLPQGFHIIALTNGKENRYHRMVKQ